MTLETSICECWDIPETPSYIPARLFGHFRAVMQGQSWNGFCIETWLVCFVCLSSLQRQVCSIGDLINQSSSCSRSSSFPLCNESWPVKYVIFLPTFHARAPLGRLAANVVRHSPSTCGFWIAQPKMAFDPSWKVSRDAFLCAPSLKLGNLDVWDSSFNAWVQVEQFISHIFMTLNRRI